jgi:DNA polymerase III subunit gamma/tau
MSLANKHRPDNFDKIIWQDHITHILKAQMNSDQKVHHNYLLFGPRGTGKTTAARILAKAINCLDIQDGNPCNQCANCTTINKWQTLDYMEIDAASHTWVDNIREEILDKVAYPATQLHKKVYVIDEVHMLSKWAFNALLKTIEEPRDNMCFILATTEIHKVLETIISRCQVFNFKKVLENYMIPHLQNICNLEWLSFDDEALNLISKISEWCVRDAVKYVDQVSVFGDISTDNVTKFLGIAGESVIKDFLDLIKSKDRDAVFQKIDEIHNQWVDLVQFAKQNIMYIDQNLMSDVDFLIQISEAFSEIIGTVKYYPYPTMVYKVALNRYLWTQNKIMETQNTVEKTNNTTPTTQVNNKKMENEENITEPKTKDDTKNIVENNTENEEKNILNQLIEKVESKTLKDNLRDHTFIKNIQEWKINFVVINKMAEIVLSKDETQKMLEEKLFEITWQRLVINVEFQSKEDYFANQI